MRKTRFLVVALMLALVAAACGDDGDAETTTTAAPEELTQQPGVLTVGSDIPFEPFEFYTDDGELVGFDVELIAEMANRLGLTVEWVETDFDTIFTQLATGRFDVVASATTITAERAQQVNFTTPYYLSEQALTVNTSLTPGIRAVSDLGDGDRVAVQLGTTGEAWAQENLAPLGVDVVSYPEAADTYIALEGGQVEAVVFDEASANTEAATRPGLEVVEVITTGEEYGFGVDPARTALLGELNRVFDAMLSDGTYQAIYDEWFPDAPAGSVLYAMEDPMADWPPELVFGFVPSREAEELQDNVDVLAQILSDALGIEVSGIVTSDYTALGVALGTGAAQIGAFAPANYVLASRVYPNIELLAQSVRFGSATYHAQYFTNDPSVCGADPVEGAYDYDAQGNVMYFGPTETPALQVGWNADGTRDESVAAGLVCPEPVDVSVVAGGSMAFGTETSTSGYIFPVLELRGAGLTQDVDYTSTFSGSHDNSVLAVYSGDSDFGVSFDDARRNVRETNPDVGERVIVFNITAPIANDVIAVDANLPQSLKDAIFNAIADFMATEEGVAVMDDIYSWTDLTRADDITRASFVLIEQAIDELGFGT